MKFLFVGLGGIGQRHLRNLTKICPNTDELYAYRMKREQFILDNNLQIQDDTGLESRYNIKVVDTLEDAFKHQIDAVFICNPSAMHMDIICQAVNHGCDFFVEKPISDSYVYINEISRIIKQKKLVTFVGYQQRYNPCIVKTRALLMKGAIGKILSVSAEIGENVKNWHKYEDYRKMYACRKELGGGVVLSQIHELDYLFSFWGMPESVYAVGGKLSDLEIDVEDTVDILMKYKIEGITVPVHIHEDYIQTPPSRVCKIIGTGGMIKIDLINANILQYSQDGKCILQEKFEFERNDMFYDEIKNFLSCMSSRTETDIPFDMGTKSLQIAMGIKKSLETGNIEYL